MPGVVLRYRKINPSFLQCRSALCIAVCANGTWLCDHVFPRKQAKVIKRSASGACISLCRVIGPTAM